MCELEIEQTVNLCYRTVVTPTTPSFTEGESDGPTFMTELAPKITVSHSSEYLQSFNIETDYFTELKKCVRINFITYMEVGMSAL